MILDTSAIVAVVLEEDGYERMRDALAEFQTSAAGTPTLAEAGIVLTAKLGFRSRALLVQFIDSTGVISVPFGEEHWREAISAHARFGKGRHPARLNLGDCMTYAVAKLAKEPLLTLDRGFAHTDLELV
ncbi:MAG: type II toxin-antitoxin system VapC family toxin [Actinobacteria bacterium]|nr:type II toxin-antitoxin system VapC family toxin [Actinomycetota bacterium]